MGAISRVLGLVPSSGGVVCGRVAGGCMGFSRCRLCGISNGNLERTDGTYVWPDGLAHYVDVHAVRLPSDLIAHAIASAAHADAVRDRADKGWWLTHARRDLEPRR